MPNSNARGWTTGICWTSRPIPHRPHFLRKTREDFIISAPKHYTEPQYPDNTYLVFGREDRGLPEELLHANPECCVRLPMIAGARSLNLSNTVAVAVYEALRQWEFPELQNAGKLTKYEWNG